MCSPHEIPRRFHATPLFSEHYVLAIGDDHRFNGRDSVTMSELDREHYCERTNCEFSGYIERLLRDRGVRLDVVQGSAREDWIAAYVRSNFGVAFMPVSIAAMARLAYVYTEDCPIVRSVGALVQAERPAHSAQQAVLNALAAHRWEPARAHAAGRSALA